jgi:pimeloyl-ACP methyl ester carboxylesterase
MPTKREPESAPGGTSLVVTPGRDKWCACSTDSPWNALMSAKSCYVCGTVSAACPCFFLPGHPRTHVTWHRVAPRLAETHTVVCPDLRGYGQSSKPPTTDEHEPYSKRAMARGCIGLMRALGHDRFAVAGHDRGSYVAFRHALDYPEAVTEAVTQLIVMDSVPIADVLARCDARFARAWFHWFLLGQTDRPAERLINSNPDAWYTATSECRHVVAVDVSPAIRLTSSTHVMRSTTCPTSGRRSPSGARRGCSDRRLVLLARLRPLLRA